MLNIALSALHKKRLLLVGVLLIGISASAGLVLYALKQNINLFYSPTEILSGQAPMAHTFRLGGMLKENTLSRGEGLKVDFILTDYVSDIKVTYDGILPDLFREGQGVVALGALEPDGTFVAHEVLARHDENYMPPEVSHALETAEATQLTENQG